MDIGAVWDDDIARHRDVVLNVYGEILRKSSNTGVSVTRDIPYGAHPRQVLDCFVPDDASNSPVMFFLHGGSFVGGCKRVTDEVYDNVLYWAARQGFVGINVEYRLAPESVWPGGADDFALALEWMQTNVSRYGGNPASVFAMGHSAGGTHLGTYAFDPAAAYFGRGLKGLVLLSPRMRADALPENPFAGSVRSYFGADDALYDARSPATHVGISMLPLMIAISEFENPLLDVYGLELAYRVASARRKAPRFIRLAGHNHISMIAHFNTCEDDLGQEIVAFTRYLM
nr:alpha/beta hydrolase [Rhizobium cauense]